MDSAREEYIFKALLEMQDEIKNIKETIKNISSQNVDESPKNSLETSNKIAKIEAALKVHTNHIAFLEQRTAKWSDKLRFGKFKLKSVQDEVETSRCKANITKFNFNED